MAVETDLRYRSKAIRMFYSNCTYSKCFIQSCYFKFSYCYQGCVPDRNFKKEDDFEQNVNNYLTKTNKVLLLISTKFLKRVYGVLNSSKIIDNLVRLHANRSIDVISIFLETIQLDQNKYSNLMGFENLDASGHFFDWNYLRILLIRQLPSEHTKRPAGKLCFSKQLQRLL